MTASIDAYGWQTTYCPHTVKRHSARSIEHDWTFVDIVPHVQRKLVAMGVLTVGDLTHDPGRIAEGAGVGPNVLAGIKQNLADLGLALKTKRPAPSPPTESPPLAAAPAFTAIGNVIRPTAWSRA